ncbi:hypothetical protein HOD38_01310 [archaeon]|jgi:hypothetical protein|nr:hypothetical protein [archaeon]MBT4396883.1 hypothetical protein [archaeon]MBT4441439.1 hypothetical protein [archaeon]
MKRRTYFGKRKSIFKRKELYTYLVGIFIIMLMVLSVVNLNSDEPEQVEYNGLTFVATESGFLAYTEEGEQVVVLSNPEELKELEIEEISLGSLTSLSKMYISLNPEDNYRNAVYDFYNNIELSTWTTEACYEDNELCSTLPIKTCEDATESIGVIIFKEDNETILSLDDNCLTIQGKDLLKVTDKLILDQYG